MRTRSSEGWGQLPRTIARALAGIKLNGYEAKLIWAMVYKTIAFNKVEDRFPRSQMVKLTGINRRHLDRTINSLLKKGVIFRRGLLYGIQRDLSKWEIAPNQVYTKRKHLIREKIAPNQGKNVPEEVHSRDLSKRTIQEKGLSTRLGERKEREVPKGLKDLIESIGNSPEKKKEKYRLLKKNQR